MFERYIEKEVLPVCQSAGIGQVVFSPLAGGVLTGKYKPGQELPKDSRGADSSVHFIVKSYLRDDVLSAVQQLSDLAAGMGISVGQLALAWTLRQPGVSSALIGATKAHQVEENVKAVDVELSEATLSDIERLLDPVRDFAPLR